MKNWNKVKRSIRKIKNIKKIRSIRKIRKRKIKVDIVVNQRKVEKDLDPEALAVVN